MTEARTMGELDDFLAGACIDHAVTALRPDYRALLIAVDGITPSASDGASEDLLTSAEAAAQTVLAAGPVEDVPHVAAWREAYRAFGAAHPQQP
jgi:DNA/RNA-binding domain of Phe-tRNA-synthetase-like protein